MNINVENEMDLFEQIRQLDEDNANFIKEMTDEVRKGTADQEIVHMGVDDLLLKIVRAFGFHKTADAFEELPKWYA